MYEKNTLDKEKAVMKHVETFSSDLAVRIGLNPYVPWFTLT